MFKHLLLPTDGTALSEDAVRRGMRFARELGAKVTGFYAMPEFRVMGYTTAMLKDTETMFETQAVAHAEAVLGYVQAAAQKEGVACDTVMTTSDRPYEAIIKAAQDRGCDLILMASHGRRGVEGFLLGSETQKVLAHSRIPVLVHR
ncbi:sulfate transporter [Acidovorax sp. SRB_14]|uniref:universal stress protein n=1 Tax=unclassified Acidovorax TaxID=2684926 RepID=UPI00145EDEF2|nr:MULTISPECIES: universal stress protein [unclassified Acidovorax]NMM75714.1 sulfate transporter [Acidovorax sp. SRB_24]NMM79672.1 sulfate transporter [Acidovorax sp. SRB_14]NMM87152.1 sulfate transporter [Rhodococcus sp. SRB_17]